MDRVKYCQTQYCRIIVNKAQKMVKLKYLALQAQKKKKKRKAKPRVSDRCEWYISCLLFHRRERERERERERDGVSETSEAACR